MAGDNIYNGAQDNATGCGMLLEIARAFAGVRQPPKRSIYFAAVTAEEQGLLRFGISRASIRRLPARTSRWRSTTTMCRRWACRRKSTSPAPSAPRSIPWSSAPRRNSGWRLCPTRSPAPVTTIRSDHFSFARVGVPAFSIDEGDKYRGHDREWGTEQAQDYVAHHYHQPSDEYRPDMDFRGDAVMARFGIALGWQAASQPALVGWQPGDEFGKIRAASEKE